MAVDLTGLTPYRQASTKVLEQSFQPTGGVNEDELAREVQKRLWGTGTSAGVYSQMARRGLNELQPETMYASGRVVSDSIQKLADEYSARQRAAIETGRTTEMVEPNFRLSEAGVTGDYGGAPTLARALGTRELDIRGQEAATRSEQLANDLSFRQNLLLGSSIGAGLQGTGLLDYVRSVLFGTAAGTPGGGGLIGGVAGGATQGLVPKAIQAIGEWLGFGSNAAAYTPEQRAIIDSMTRQDAMVELMNMGQGGATGGAGGGAGGAVGGAISGVGAANTVSGMVGGPTIQGLLTGAPAGMTAAQQAASIEMAREAAMAELAAMGGPAGVGTGAGVGAGVGPAAPSIEVGLIEMLGPELAAQLGYTAPVAAAPAAAALGGPTMMDVTPEALMNFYTAGAPQLSQAGIDATSLMSPGYASLAGAGIGLGTAEIAKALGMEPGAAGALGSTVGFGGGMALAGAAATPAMAVAAPLIPAIMGLTSMYEGGRENRAYRNIAQDANAVLSQNPQWFSTIQENMKRQIADMNTGAYLDNMWGRGDPFYGTPLAGTNLSSYGGQVFGQHPELQNLWGEWGRAQQNWNARATSFGVGEPDTGR